MIETREVNADSNSEIVFDCNVNSGVYFVRIISGNNVWTKRVVIEK
ncbi:MAG: T9SS type A sorting domain-containing protein [Bacteroidales bacterium]|nr:T9SS type A sorting domain-containing protein [Bacteroidales bacterium]